MRNSQVPPSIWQKSYETLGRSSEGHRGYTLDQTARAQLFKQDGAPQGSNTLSEAISNLWGENVAEESTSMKPDPEFAGSSLLLIQVEDRKIFDYK